MGEQLGNLYYFCPEHGVRLQWNRHSPHEHRCPVDGKVLTGEPYDGAWWRWLNGLNAKACYNLGLLWNITGKVEYLDKVKDILSQYARYYPDYQVHGGIPYNGPGKANAQTLCEANCHLDLALGYDLIKASLSHEERATIESRLLREGADFLIEHRSPQLHNHEMKINATIGVIGLILGEASYLDFALNTDYGIHYQLNHGSSEEGMWFEGSIHYHYYALQALLSFEKLARNTAYSVSSNPNFVKMLKFPLNLVLNTGDFPRLNDCIAGQERLTHSQLFEFAYSQYPCELFASALASIYQNTARDNIDALLYGVESLPIAAPLSCQSIHTTHAGITIHYDKKHNNAMLFKHSPYGGEHDHYDRLGVILVRNGKEILPDLGTTGYGAELHYGYYKNSATHNTLAVNQQNQPPTNPRLHHYHNGRQVTLIDAVVDWNEQAPKVDSHTIVQWDDLAYQGIIFRRIMICLGSAYIELNQIANPFRQQLDLTYHIRGQHLSLESMDPCDNPQGGPLSRMHTTHISSPCRTATLSYSIDSQTPFNQHFWFDSECQLLLGYAPDNPATHDLAYSIAKSTQTQLKTAVLHDLSPRGNLQLASLEWAENRVCITVTEGPQRQQVNYCLETKAVTHKILV